VGPDGPVDDSLWLTICFCMCISLHSSRASTSSSSKPSRRHRFQPDAERGGGGKADRHGLLARLQKFA